MRGIIAEVKGKRAVILAQDGTFRKMRASADMIVGSEVDLSRTDGNTNAVRLMKRVSSIAAAALFVIGIGYGAYCYTLPYTYVDVDINPSIELTANIYDRIIKVEALNHDAKKMLAEHNLKNTRLDKGISELLDMAVEGGYLKTGDSAGNNAGSNTSPAALKPDSGSITTGQADGQPETAVDNAVLLTVSSSNIAKSVEIRKQIVRKATEELIRSNVKSDVLAGEASVQQKKDARALGVTPGKLALIEDAMEDQPELKLEDLKKFAVKDLVKKAKAKKAKSDQISAGLQNDNSGELSDSITSPAGIDGRKGSTGNSPDYTIAKQDKIIAAEKKHEQSAVLQKSQTGQKEQKNNSSTVKDSDIRKKESAEAKKPAGAEKTSEKVKENAEAKAVLENKRLQSQKLKDELLNQIQQSQQKQPKVQNGSETQADKTGNEKENTGKGNKEKLQKKSNDSMEQGSSVNGRNEGNTEKGQSRKSGR